MTHRAAGGDRSNYCPTMSLESSAVYSLSNNEYCGLRPKQILLCCNYVGLRFKHPSIRPLLTKKTNLFSVFDCESFAYTLHRCPRPLKTTNNIALAMHIIGLVFLFVLFYANI